jgi:hypothetical protein
MLELERQVTSMHLSYKLKSLDIIQESYFYWCTDDNNRDWYIDDWKISIYADYPRPKKICSAFMASELMSLLNAEIHISKPFNSDISRIDKHFNCNTISIYYQPENGTDNSYTFEGTNLADLLAEVLIAQINEGEFYDTQK